VSYFPQLPSPGPCILQYGNNSVASAADTRYLSFGFTNQVAQTSPNASFIAPRDGSLKNFTARHNNAVGNGNPVEYDVEINGVPQGISLSVVTGAISDGSDLVSIVNVSAGDVINLIAVKPAAIGSGAVNAAVVVEFD